MKLTELLSERPVVLLDFDGPVCAVFGGEQSASEVAQRLVGEARARGVPLPFDVAASADPFTVLWAAAARGPAEAAIVEAVLRNAEVHAVASAPMAVGLPEALTALRNSGHTITVVSNNSDAAVRAFLARQHLTAFITHVVGRTEPDPALLKPHPHLVLRAIADNHTDPEHCVLIGDSTTDITAARRAGTAVIAYANKPGKREALVDYSPEALIERLHDLARAATLPYVS